MEHQRTIKKWMTKKSKNNCNRGQKTSDHHQKWMLVFNGGGGKKAVTIKHKHMLMVVFNVNCISNAARRGQLGL